MASLTPQQQSAWRSLVLLAHSLEEALDRQARRDGGIPHAYYKLLVFLFEAGGRRLSMSELAADLGYSSSRLTHAVSSLERSGWVRRARSTQDRRVSHVELTDAGSDVVRRVTPGQVAELRMPALEGIDDADLERLTSLATVIATRMRLAHVDGPPSEAAGHH